MDEIGHVGVGWGAVNPNKSWVAREQDRLPVGGARVEPGRPPVGRVGLRQARQDKIEGGRG